jgi:hypothetical protein
MMITTDSNQTLASEPDWQATPPSPEAPPAAPGGQTRARTDSPARSKKEQILQLFLDGEHDLAAIIRQTGATPSYTATVLTQAGLLTGYFDLYTATSQPQNLYSKFFRGALAFKSLDAARASVERIDRLFHYFERLGDRAGQHHAQVIALTGRNRARWCGKSAEAQLFADWLLSH